MSFIGESSNSSRTHEEEEPHLGQTRGENEEDQKASDDNLSEIHDERDCDEDGLEEDDDDPESGSAVGESDSYSSCSTQGEDFKDVIKCCCYDPADVLSSLCLMDKMCKDPFNNEMLDCYIDNCVRCLNIVLEFCTDVISKEKVAAIDLFYRFRHEILFNLIAWSFNLPSGKTDIPFSNYGIDSSRTPDLIYELNGVHYIIEVTAVGSFERGAQSKGVEEMGFEGKYRREITLMNESGHSTKYFPIIFNMNDVDMPYDVNQMDSLGSVFVKSKTMFNLMVSKAKQLCIITQDIKGCFTLSSTLLFSNLIKLPEAHEGHKFIYERSTKTNINYDYEEIVISPYVFSKVDNNWSRFEDMIIRKGIPDSYSAIFKLNYITGRFSVEVRRDGLIVSDLLSIIQSNDKVSFFKNLKLVTNYGEFSSVDNEKGVKFYLKRAKAVGRHSDKGESSIKDPEERRVQLFYAHGTSIFKGCLFNLNHYNKYMDSEEGISYNYKDFDNSYEERLVNSICKFDSKNNIQSLRKHNLLGLKPSSEIDLGPILDGIKENYISCNSKRDEIPLKVLKMKQPFILPISGVNSMDYSSLSYKNIEMINCVSDALPINNEYTKKVLESIKNPNFVLFHKGKAPSMVYLDLVKRRFEVSNRINSLQKKLYRSSNNNSEAKKISKTENPEFRIPFTELRSEYRELSKLIRDRAILEKTEKGQGMVRLPTKGKSGLSIEYKEEMDHFKSKKNQSTIEGVGIRNSLETDYEHDLDVFNSISNRLTTYSGENKDPLIHNYVSDDAKLLKDLKKIALENFSQLMRQVVNSQLGHSAAFISRLCHTLMYLSQQSFNSDYVKIDNLGYSNVLLLVKGGKKIFKTKSSKFFRLVCPIIPECVPWYKGGHSNEGSSTIFNYNSNPYLITPWIMLHESILTDGISFYPRVCSFSILNLDYKIDFQQQFHKISMNVLLAFHNRRQTEVLLANLRYILLSTMGDFTGVDEILQEFFGFNYDCFQSFIRNSILFNYPKYFNTLQSLKELKSQTDIRVSDFKAANLKNIFTNQRVTSQENLALMIYSTFLMTKAPYQRSVERANNLKGILRIHDYYTKTVNINKSPEEQAKSISVTLDDCVDDDYNEYVDKLFSNDFCFDPKFCAAVGNFINSEFNSKNLKEEIHNKWYSILASSWDEMSTSTGLRGHYGDLETFWGQKGYFVVYKDLMSDKDFMLDAQRIMLDSTDDSTKRKLLKRLNRAYTDKIDVESEFLIFHAVDKVQWRGGREIYVMDIDTKILQQPIEKFMGYLCQKMDNELISIPSDKRSQVIHHSIFEKDLPLKDKLVWYLTLDCTKWAPKSVFIKFIITFLCMDSLPNSFKRHFLNYIEKLFYKRIYFNDKEVEVLANNPNYKSLCDDYLVKDTVVNGYYLNMPYSWVMGIFNYTSSFLHAANQKYMSYIIMKTSVLSYQEETSLFMFAHSDDSGGRLTVSSKEMAVRALVLYEVGVKSCNHLLSKKKSVISRIYFEILSIIYLFKQLLALLPKFLGGLRFLPTDKGACQDMSQSYSKCIEVIIAGADFSVAYIVLKIYSMMIWRFYYNQDPEESDYLRPVQYMGLPDAHPLLILLCGSDSDIIRIHNSSKAILPKLINFSNSLIQTTGEAGPIKPYKFEIKVKNIKRGFEESIDLFRDYLDVWSVRNVNYHNSFLNFLNFLSKLRDSGFVGSLVNESSVRRFSRAYFMKNNDVIMTNMGNLSINNVLDSLRLYQKYTSGVKAVEMIFHGIFEEEEIRKINDSIFESTSLVQNNMKVLEETLQSPLRMYVFLNQLSMDNRKISFHQRTLKPTVVQLIKSTPVFSSRFDPASLVSYIKDEDMRWAIPDVKGIFTAALELEELFNRRGLVLEDTDPDNLLKICRDFGPNSSKTIYLYSRVPSELRHVKSYSAFLTFLSVNSFNNSEITGLTVRLNQNDMAVDYTKQNIDDDVYTMINILSSLCVLYSKTGIEFFEQLTLKEIPNLSFKGGKIKELLEHIEVELSHRCDLSYYLPYMNYLKIILNGHHRGASQLTKGAFYTFMKSQKMKSGWFGKGEIYINIEGRYYSFMLFNSNVTSVITNQTGKIPQHHSDYIFDIMHHNNIDVHNLPRVGKKSELQTEEHFGFDYSGHLSVCPKRELTKCIPCLIKSIRTGFVNELFSYDIVALNNNAITIRSELFNKVDTRKIYALPLRKGEIINTFMQILKKEEFENKLAQEGLESFEEFVLTELLTEYGSENYIEFEEMMDNFQASNLFRIFSYCRKNNVSQIPKQLNFSSMPASEGSLTRILYDYSVHSNDNILSINRDINSTFLQVVSEYPETMTVILSNKLVDFFKNMFDIGERREISDEYHSLSDSNDPEIVRNSVIKLMTYWGYGGLVNSVQNFSLKRTPENYTYFNLACLATGKGAYYADLFVFTVKCLINEMLNWSEQYSSLEFKNRKLRSPSGMRSVITNYIRYVCLSCYKYQCLDLLDDINIIQFNTTVIQLLQEEDFCSSLQLELGKNYIMGSLVVNYSVRDSFIVMMNTLRHVWCLQNRIDFDPDFSQKNERLPDAVPSWKSLSRCFGHETPPTMVLYGGSILNSTVQEILKRGNRVIRTRFGSYFLSSSVKNYSDTAVLSNEEWKPIRPIKSSVFDSPDWEDMQSDIEMDDLDPDMLETYKENIGHMYVKKSTVIKGFGKDKEIYANVSWVMGCMNSCKNSKFKYLRQVGQNLILVSSSYTPAAINNIHNCKIRVIQYTKGEILFCYISFQDELNNDELIDQLVGRLLNVIDDSDVKYSMSGLVRDRDGLIKPSTDIGVYFDSELMAGDAIYVEDDDTSTIKKVLKTNLEGSNDGVDLSTTQNSSEEERIEQIMSLINSFRDKGLSKETTEKLKNKYLSMVKNRDLVFKVVLKSLLDESVLNSLVEDLNNSKVNLNPTQYKETFIAPKHFGATHGVSDYRGRNIKNKNVKAEIEAFNSELSEKVGSGIVHISPVFKKIVSANIKFWSNSVKHTNYKKENKTFSIITFITLLNCAHVSEDSEDDSIWQACINKMTLYISEEKEESDEDDLMSLLEDIKSFSRLKYMPKGA